MKRPGGQSNKTTGRPTSRSTSHRRSNLDPSQTPGAIGQFRIHLGTTTTFTASKITTQRRAPRHPQVRQKTTLHNTASRCASHALACTRRPCGPKSSPRQLPSPANTNPGQVKVEEVIQEVPEPRPRERFSQLRVPHRIARLSSVTEIRTAAPATRRRRSVEQGARLPDKYEAGAVPAVSTRRYRCGWTGRRRPAAMARTRGTGKSQSAPLLKERRSSSALGPPTQLRSGSGQRRSGTQSPGQR
jgi:hypothetical protein